MTSPAGTTTVGIAPVGITEGRGRPSVDIPAQRLTSIGSFAHAHGAKLRTGVWRVPADPVGRVDRVWQFHYGYILCSLYWRSSRSRCFCLEPHLRDGVNGFIPCTDMLKKVFLLHKRMFIYLSPPNRVASLHKIETSIYSTAVRIIWDELINVYCDASKSWLYHNKPRRHTIVS